MSVVSVVILFGSEMGTAEKAADVVADVLGREVDVSVFDMADFDIADLDPSDFHVFVCSTYGSGDLPTTAEPFIDAVDAARPDLTGLRYAVFGLGDSVYDDTFNRAGEIIAEKIGARGGVQVGVHARHDGSSEIRVQDMARDWATEILPLCSRAILAG